MSGKVRFEESRILNKWVALHCNDKKAIFGKHKKQGEKPRISNKFIVVGANTYLGWGTICQLAYKFPGSEIVCVDERYSNYSVVSLTSVFPFLERVEILNSYFDVNVTTEKIIYSKYIDINKFLNLQGDCVIVYLSENIDGFNNFMRANEKTLRVPFLYADSITSKRSLHETITYTFPVFNIKYSNIIGTYNLLTLVDHRLSPMNIFSTRLNSLIYEAISCKKMKLQKNNINFYATSLENITRAIVKSIRRGWKGTSVLRALEAKTDCNTFSKIISDTMNKYYNIDCGGKNLKTRFEIPEKNRSDIRFYERYLDKFRISLKETIAYSTINVIEDNHTEIHKGQVFNKMKKGNNKKEKIVSKHPSGDYKHFAVQKYPKSISEYYSGPGFKDSKFITKKTNIVSIGSCFAMEIGKFLKRNNYNYPIYENNDSSFNANWGIVFNSSSIRQIIEDAFDRFKPFERFWEREENRMQDIFRRNTTYQKGEHELKLEKHRKKSHLALSNAEVLIVTLGLVEVWRDKRDHSVFWRVPPITCYDPNKYEFYVMNVEDVYSDLKKIKNVLNDHNPNCNMVVTVSPVPFQTTFRKDCDVVSANVYSKAVSSVAANQFCCENRNNGVYYFPSFEYIRYGFDNPYIDDGRHIKKPIVNKMMKFFEKTFVIGE